MRSAHESKHCHSFSKSCNITEPQFCFLRCLFVSEMLKLSLITLNWASLVAQMVENLPAMPETQIWSLGWEDPLEKEMATDSSILAWRIPWIEDPGGLQVLGSQRVGHDWVTRSFTSSLIHLCVYAQVLYAKTLLCLLLSYILKLNFFLPSLL